MRVDVVIPAFGRPALLNEAIESVLRQTYSDLSLFVVDDGSPHPIAPQVVFSDPRLKLLRLEKNGGSGPARNYGVAAGTSPLIAFLDSDDLWQPQKLEHQVRYLQEHHECQWLHCNELWLRSGVEVKQRPEHRKQGGRFLERAFGRCLIATSAVMLRRGFFERHGGFARPFRVCQDYELWLRLLADAPVGFLEDALAIKRTGDWLQASATPEIDRFRVLALHRFYRQIRRDATAQAYIGPLLSEAERKSRMLVAGAEKHGNRRRLGVYHAWFTLFKALRTRLMR